METLDCITLRRSIRKYKDLEVEMDKIGQLVLAARDAPSSGNLQNWRFIVVDNPETRQAIAQACSGQLWMSKAPVHIVVVGDIDRANMFYGIRGERLYTIQNCAAAVQNMLLAACDLGLGTCWVGAFDEEQLADILGIPGHMRPQAIVTVGYPAEQPPQPSWKQELYNIMFLNSYGGRIKNVDHVLGYHSEKVVRAVNFTKNQAQKGHSKIKELIEKGKANWKKKKEETSKLDSKPESLSSSNSNKKKKTDSLDEIPPFNPGQ